MRTFALCDIHGNNRLLLKALHAVNLMKEDRLVMLGDAINKGDDSKGVLDTILQLREEGFEIICLMGNHEQLFLNALDNEKDLGHWLLHGGFSTLRSFDTHSIGEIPKPYIELIRGFEFIYEAEAFVFVHAGVNMKIGDPYSDKKTMLWERFPYKYLDESWLKNRILIHGHTPTRRDLISSSIKNREPIICIDNGTYSNREKYGSQCILELETFAVRFIEKDWR